MVQAANKRLVTEASVGGHVATQVTTPGTATATALSATFVPTAQVAKNPVTAATGTYDPLTGLYNYKPKHLRKFRAKLAQARAGTGFAKIATIGDSITAGQGANSQTESWPVLLRDAIVASGVPLAGTGPVPAVYGDSAADPRWVATGTWSVFVSGGFKSILRSSGTAGSVVTFTSDKPGTVLELWYSKGSGTFEISVDGGAWVSKTGVGGSDLDVHTVTGLANTTHTVAVRPISGMVYVGPANVRTATSGLLVANIGSGGGKASDGYASNAGFGQTKFTTTSWVADLATVAFMTNDINGAVPVADYKTNVTNIVTALQAAAVDVLLIAQIPAWGKDLTPYRTALFEVANTKDVPVLDMFERWGTFASADGFGMMSDAFHPTKVGYSDYVRAVLNAIAP